MQDRKIEVFTEEDEQIVNQLRAIGMTRKAAKVLTYLMQKGAGAARDIEISADLRQPEVSVGLKELSTWLDVELVTRAGYRRPVTIYAMKVPFKEVVNHYYDIACKNRNAVTIAYKSLVEMHAKV